MYALRKHHFSYLWRYTLAITLGLTLTGCFEKLEGSGQSSTEHRDIAGVRNISISSAGTLHISISDTESLTVSGDDNILEIMETTHIGDSLLIEPSIPDVFINPKSPLIYDIQVKSLEDLNISGKMHVTVTGLYNQNFNLTSQGLLDIYLQGQSDNMGLVQSGVSNLDAKDLTIDTLNIDLTGSADVAVSVTSAINGSLAGVSKLTYFGGPVLNVEAKDYATADIGIEP